MNGHTAAPAAAQALTLTLTLSLTLTPVNLQSAVSEVTSKHSLQNDSLFHFSIKKKCPGQVAMETAMPQEMRLPKAMKTQLILLLLL